MFERLREPKELRQDPRYEYMVGRLVGAAEMMANYMALHGDEKARGMAGRVDEVLGFFVEQPVASKRTSGYRIAGEIEPRPPSEEDTAIRPPARSEGPGKR